MQRDLIVGEESQATNKKTAGAPMDIELAFRVAIYTMNSNTRTKQRRRKKMYKITKPSFILN